MSAPRSMQDTHRERGAASPAPDFERRRSERLAALGEEARRPPQEPRAADLAPPLPERGGGRSESEETARYRRRSAPARRRRRTLVSLLRRFAIAAALVALPVVLVLWVAALPELALDELAITGLRQVDRGWVEEALQPFRGRNLLLLSLGTIRAVLLRHPWIRAVELEKELPRRLRLTVVERQPVALVRRGAELRYLDAEGGAIAPYDPASGPADLLVVIDEPSDGKTAGPRSLVEALAVAGDLSRINPNWGGGLTEIEVLGDEDFRVRTAALPFPLLVRSRRFTEQARQLEALLPELLRRYGQIAAVDLRFARRIVIEPAAPVVAASPAGASG